MSRSHMMAEKSAEKIINFKDYFKTKKGKEVLYELCKFANYFGDPPVELSTNKVLFDAGKRSVINHILVITAQDPKVLLEEFRKRQHIELYPEEE